MSDRNYRPEIDGLRAVSVIGVLLFHIGLGVPGGFVGVDVFFVISGYLITGIIVRNLRAGTFSLADFWVRRIRRILPAAWVMAAFTLVAGSFILTPRAYANLAESAIAQALVVSNFLFARQEGYFAESADFIPLLHTWSLAVEEQFYILFPLLLSLAWRRARRAALPALVVVGVMSLGWSCFAVGHHPKAAFFLLPARAWELVVGALLALAGRSKVGGKLAETLSALGLAMIIVSMLVFHRLTPFPGLHALLPVVGAGMFIFGNSGKLTRCGQILALKPVVFIGLISYSLYLWHWPLLVFAKHLVIDLDFAWKCGLIVMSLLLATLSWRFVETPFRRSDGVLKSRPRAFAFAGASVTTLVVAGWIIWGNNGLVPTRGDQIVALLLEDADWRGDEYVGEDDVVVQIGTRSGDLDFVFWGDSHGMAVARTVDQVAEQSGLRGEAILSAGIPPVTGLFFHDMEAEEREAMLARNEQIVARLIRDRVPHVILVGRWVARCDGYNDAEMIDREPDYRLSPMILDSPDQEPRPVNCAAALGRQLGRMLSRLRDAGIEVWIIRQVPETNHRETARLVAMQRRFPLGNRLEQFTISLDDHRRRASNAGKVFASLPDGLAEVIDPTERFFGEGERLKIFAERSYYRDDDHLTRFGADYYMTPIFEKIFEQMGD